MKKDNEGLSEFIKFAYKHNGVKDVKEAFREFPPEEEWHKGRVEYFIKDDKSKEKESN